MLSVSGSETEQPTLDLRFIRLFNQYTLFSSIINNLNSLYFS